VHAVLANKQMWDQDLTQISGLEGFVLNALKKIRSDGAESAFASLLH
jgi:tagaturonate reductase (EC 1.1.1.58)